MIIRATSILHERLVAAGIPIHGCDRAGVYYLPEATKEQRDQGDAMHAAHDWEDKEVADESTLLTRVNGLTPAARNAILNRMIVEYISRRPSEFVTAGQDPYRAAGAARIR